MQFQRFDTIKKKHWSPTTVSAIVRDEIYIGTRIWGKTRCSMHTGHKAVLNDETEWVRLENHHTAIIDRQLFEKANEMHPKNGELLQNHAPILPWKDVKNSQHCCYVPTVGILC